MWCHLIFFGFPVLGLPLFWLLPFPVALAAYVPGTVISVGVGLATVRALSQPPTTGAEAMVGRVVRVEAVDGRKVVVRVDDELWNAVVREAVIPGQRVVIMGLNGLRLAARPAEPETEWAADRMSGQGSRSASF